MEDYTKTKHENLQNILSLTFRLMGALSAYNVLGFYELNEYTIYRVANGNCYD